MERIDMVEERILQGQSITQGNRSRNQRTRGGIAKGMMAGMAALAFTLTGCVENSGNPPSKEQQGAVAGAIVGGFYGLTRKGDNSLLKGAVGATIGAAVGGAIGHYLDSMEKDLRHRVKDDRVKISRSEGAVTVTMPNALLFPTGSAEVGPEMRQALAQIADHLKAYPDTTVDVIGHTDNVGDAAYNMELSRRRAENVALELARLGIDPDRIRAFGRGEDDPVASNLTEEGRARNRRVEIVIRPRQG